MRWLFVFCAALISTHAYADDDDFDELPHARPRTTYKPLPPLPVVESPSKEDSAPAAASTSGSMFSFEKPRPAADSASSQPATQEAKKEEAPPDRMRKGELSMLGVAEFLNDINFAGAGIGYFGLDSVHYISVTPMVDLSFFDSRLHLNFGAPLNITLFDPNGGGFAVPASRRIRVQDWDEWQDWFKIIRRVQWGRKEDRFFARLGRVGATSIGHGGLMRRYNNNMLANSTRVGFEVDFNTDYGGAEAFLSDITLQGSRVLSGLAFVKPLGWMQHYAAKSLSLGFVYAGDFGAPSGLRRDAEGVVIMDRGGNPTYDQTGVHGLGASVEVKPIRIGDMIDVKTYVEFNQLLGAGNGITVGALGRFNFGPIGLRARAEYRNIGNQFIPSYFDNFYEIQKLQVVTFNPSTFAPTKLDFLRSLRYPSGRASNGYFEVTFSWIDKLALSVAYEGGGDPLLQNFLVHAELTAFTWLRFFATYHKRNFSSFAELFSFSQNDLLYAQARLAILPILFLNGRVMKTFVWDPSVDFGLGGLRNVLDYRIDLELGWQWK